MTNEEAIEIFKEIREELIAKETELSKQVFENLGIKAIDLAIKTLEQIELNPSYNGVKTELEPCEDCISREAVFKIFDEACYIDDDWYVMRKKIEKLSSVTPTRPKGKWKILDECANEGVYCSKCHKTVFKLEFSHTMKWRNFKYCPNCGAKMEAKNESNN